MFCSQCCATTPEDAQFCHKCGKPLVVEQPLGIKYEFLSDEPRPYVAPTDAPLDSTKRQIVEVGRATDVFVMDNLKVLFERTVCRGPVPKLMFVQGTSDKERLSIEKAFSPDSLLGRTSPQSFPDFIPTLAVCCTAMTFGRTRELSPKKWMFVELFRGLVDDKISKLKTQFPDLPSVLSHAAFAACYARYLEHGGKVGLLSTPYLGYVRSLNRSLVSEAYRFRTEIETNYNGKNHILAMLSGLEVANCFAPLSDNPNAFKILPFVTDWFTRHVPMGFV